MKRRASLVVIVLSLLGVLVAGLLVSAHDVHAQVPEPVPTSTPAPTATPAPVTQSIFHILSFPFETMIEAILKMSGGIVQAFYAEAEGVFAGALDPVLNSPYGIAPDSLDDGWSTPLFRDLVAPGWEVAFSLALALLPATLALTAASALRQSAASVLGYTDLKEALIGWLFAAGAAAISLYVLGLAHRLSLSAAGAALAADFGERVSGVALARAFFNAPALAMIAELFPPAALYVGFFILFLGSTLLLALCLGLAAYTALIYLLSVIAPVVLVLSTLPPLRWLQALWLRATVVVCLIPLADAFLLKAGVSLYRGFFDPERGGSLAGFVASLFILGGVLSVLITLNLKVAEGVFGALAEVHRQAWSATAGVTQLVLSAAALAAGAFTGSALVGGLAATAIGGGSGSTGLGAPAGDGGGGDPTPAPTTSTVAPRLPDIAGRLQGIVRRMAPGSDAAGGRSNLPDEIAQARAGAAATDSAIGADTATPLADEMKAAQPGRAEPSEREAARAPSALQPIGESPAHPSQRESPSRSGRDPWPPSFAASTGLESDAAQQRARLAQGFGHLLAVATRNPAARAFGAGMQAAGAWAAYRARTGLDSPPQPELPSEAPHFEPSAVRPAEPAPATHIEPSRPHAGDSGSFIPESSRALNVEREDHAEVSEALHDSFEQSGHVAQSDHLANVVAVTFGRAPTSADPAAPPTDAQRDFFTLALDPDNVCSPGHLLGALHAWAERHRVALPDDVAERVLALFTAGREDADDSRS